MVKSADVTQLLTAVSAGDRKAIEVLLPLVYKELHQHAGFLMRRERAGHTLQPTALVHEVFLRLIQGEHTDWTCRAHFFFRAASW